MRERNISEIGKAGGVFGVSYELQNPNIEIS
jgi:hypothetical protein